MRDVELKKALRPDNSLNLKVTTSSGKELDLSLCPSQSVQHLKEKVFGDNPKDGVNFKLLSINLNRILDEKRTLEEEGVKDNGEGALKKLKKKRFCQCCSLCLFWFYYSQLIFIIITTVLHWAVKDTFNLVPRGLHFNILPTFYDYR